MTVHDVNFAETARASGAIRAAGGDPDRLDRVLPRIPIGRVGEPQDIARAIAWLLGPEAGYITGARIRVAGGL